MKLSLRIPTCVLLALASACERIDAPQEKEQQAPEQALLSPYESLAFLHSDPRLTVAHAGVRRLEYASDEGPALYFHERIATDGSGRFSIQPVGPEGSSVPDWYAFELTQHAREGFHFRYRDFVVRDANQFGTNWSVTAQQDSEVAGRACRDFRVERSIGDPISFRLSIDYETGLVLASREFDAEENTVASMVYESFELAPDPSTIAWHLPSNQESPLSTLEGLETEFGGRPLEPRLLPEGYASLETAVVSDGDGGRWLKRTYTNGVEPLFFLEAFRRPRSGRPLDQRGQPSGSMPESTSGVVVFELGSSIVVQGELDGHELMAIGRASETELLDFIESALP